MQKFIIGIISFAKNDKRTKKALQLFNQLKNYPKLIIAQGYKPERTNKNDIIVYEQEALGIKKARAKLIEQFLKLDYDFIIFMDDDNEICSINENAIFEDYNNDSSLYGMFNLQVSKKAILTVNFDFEHTVFPGEDIVFNFKLKRYFKRYEKPLFNVKHSIENSTWRTENNG